MFKKEVNRYLNRKSFLVFALSFILLGGLVFLFIFSGGITGFVIFFGGTQSDFNLGVYNNTNFSADHVQLAMGNISGTYTSKVFDATNLSIWNNISWSETLRSSIAAAVDAQSDIWVSVNSGVNWTLVKDDFNGGDSNDPNFMVVDSSKKLYVVEGDDDVWQSNDSGIKWVKVNDDYNGEGQHLRAMTIDSNDAMYIIESDEDVWKSANLGVNWTKVNGSDFNGGNGDARALISVGATIYAVDAQSDFWNSSDGVSWTLVKDDYNGGDGNGATYMIKNSTNGVYIIFNQDVWSSSDLGISWTKVNDDYNGGESNNALAAFADANDNLYLVESDEEVWKSVDSGVTWSKISADMNGGNGDLFGIAFASATTDMTLSVRSCALSDCSDEAFSGSLTNPSLEILSVSNNRYFQFKTTFTSSSPVVSAELYNFTIDYTSYTDNQKPSVSGLTEMPNDPATYANGQVYEFNATITDNIGVNSVIFVFNGVNYTTTNLSSNIFNATLIDMPAGTYNYYWYVNDTSGNANSSEGGGYTINKAGGNSVLLLNGNADNLTIQYPQKINAAASTIYGNITLYRNGVDVGAENGLNFTLSAGYYNYTATSSGDQNHSSTAVTLFANITKAQGIVLLHLNNSENNATITQGDSIYLNVSLSAGDMGNLYLYNNGTLINNGTSPLVNLTAFNTLGVHNISAFYVGSENYTSDWATELYVEVISAPDTTAPLVSINEPQSTTYTSMPILFNATINEDGICNFTIDNGANNRTMQNSGNRDFSASDSNIADGTYITKYYCWDLSNNLNDSSSRQFSVSVQQQSSSGGGSNNQNSQSNESSSNQGNAGNEFNLEILSDNSLAIKRGLDELFNIELSNNGINSVNNCKLIFNSDAGAWFSNNEETSLLGSNKFRFDIKVNVPGNTDVGDYSAEVLARCNEVEARKTIILNVLVSDFEIEIENYEIDENLLRVFYSLQEFAGNAHEIEIEYDLTDFVGRAALNGKDNFGLEPNQKIDEVIEVEIPEDYAGDFDFLISASDGNIKIASGTKIILPSNRGITGFAIFEGNRRIAFFTGIIILAAGVFLAIALKLIRSHRRKLRVKGFKHGR